jgi:hypothetical protein
MALTNAERQKRFQRKLRKAKDQLAQVHSIAVLLNEMDHGPYRTFAADQYLAKIIELSDWREIKP